MSESRFWDHVPDDWELVSGSNAYEVNPNPEPVQDKNTYIEMDALDTVLPFPNYFGERKASEYSGKTFKAGNTLFARITPCTENGKSAIVPEMETEVGVGSTEYAVLSPSREKLSPLYLYYLVNSHPVHDYAISRMRGSTGRQRVPFSVFRQELDVPLPPLPEQRKIASILYNVDQAIQKTEEIIEQTKQVKKGVMQDLFTEGYYDHDGFKETPTGRIPTSWSVYNLDEWIDLISGAHVKTDKVNDDESLTPYITGPEDFENMGFSVTKFTDDPRKYCKKGDVLVTVKGSGCGKSTLAYQKACISRQLKALRPKQGLDEKFLYYYINYRQKLLKTLAEGSAIPGLSNSHLTKLKIPVPDLNEQEKIANTLEIFDQSMKRDRLKNNRLIRLKKGLMQDLLTGKVRIHDKDIDVLDEVLQHE